MILGSAGLGAGFRALLPTEVSFDLENFSDRNCISFLLDMSLKCCRPRRKAFGSAAIREFQPPREVGISDREITFLRLFNSRRIPCRSPGDSHQ